MIKNPGKRSKSVLICAIVHIILGGFGTIIFLYIFPAYIYDLLFSKGYSFGMGVSFFVSIFLAPSVIVFIAGIGLSLLKPWARKISIMVTSPCYILLGFFLIFPFSPYVIKHGSINILFVFIILPVINIWFLTRADIKKQFGK